MKKSYSIFFFLIGLFFLSSSNPAYAAKKFVSKGTSSSAPARRISTGTIPSSVRYRPDKLGLLLSLTNFNGLESVSYSFTYTGDGMNQGIGGNITAQNDPTATRELVFGTCSGGVCRYHGNLADARLELTAKFTNGKTAVKKYRIKTYR